MVLPFKNLDVRLRGTKPYPLGRADEGGNGEKKSGFEGTKQLLVRQSSCFRQASLTTAVLSTGAFALRQRRVEQSFDEWVVNLAVLIVPASV